MKTNATRTRGFFGRLKSVFADTGPSRQISLTEPCTLRKESVRVLLCDCPIEITLGEGTKTLSLVRERFITEVEGDDGTTLILQESDRSQARVSGFLRLTAGVHLIVGREDERQEAILGLSSSVAKRHFSVVHEGDALVFKDLAGEQGTTLAPLDEDDSQTTSRRIHSLREVFRIFRGPVQLLPPDQALDDLNKVNRLLEKEPLRPHDSRGLPGGVVCLPKNMIPIIIGDLHAQVDNLLTLLTQNRFLEAMSEGRATMVFLGDAIHSEIDDCLEEMETSLLTMDLILRLKLWFPQQVFYVRGNHDSFSEEIGKGGVPQGLLWAKAVRDIRGKAYKEAMDRFYELLPFVALSNNYAACHAAPPRGKVDMDMLVNIHKYPSLIREITCNRLSRPNRPSGYTKGDVKRFRTTLNLGGKAELFVGHTPLTRHDTVWSNVGGIKHHDVVFSGNMPWVGVYTRSNGEMIPLQYRAEPLLAAINQLDDVDLYDELEH